MRDQPLAMRDQPLAMRDQPLDNVGCSQLYHPNPP
jgi:hypothetical protein